MRREKWAIMLAKVAALPPSPPPTPPLPPWRQATSTRRAKIAHKRREKGFRCFDLLISEDHIYGLIASGSLEPQNRNNRQALQNALDLFLHQALIARYQHTIGAKIDREKRQQNSHQQTKQVRKTTPKTQQSQPF
jgi:hypothetical protein